jgi:hypothetical protein
MNDLIEHMEFSYLRRNAMINLAAIANLALAPPTPGGLQVFDLGTGGGIRVQWDPLVGPGDVAGYRVAYRPSSGLDYTDVVDAGNATSIDITGLTNGLTLAVSVSAYDDLGHESVFSREKTVIPGTVPRTIPGFGVSSLSDRLALDWNLPQELDLDRIRIYRSIQPVGGFAPYDSIPPSQTHYEDLEVDPGQVYFYRIDSVDMSGLTSPLTVADKGLLATYAHGILVVDATKDGFGTPGFPTDLQTDNYYAALLSEAPVSAHWDLPESLDAGRLLTDADMAQHRTLWIHSDHRDGRLDADTLEIRQYLENGGQVFLGSWGLQQTVANALLEVGNYGSGHFFHDVMHVDRIVTTPLEIADCVGATSLDASYPDLPIDPAKWPHSGGHFIYMDVFVNDPLPGASALYAYDSSDPPPGPYHGDPVGLRVGGAGEASLVFLDQPLYFMQLAAAQACVDQALIDLGYGVASSPSGPPASSRLTLRALPNPSAGMTQLAFVLPAPAESVDLSIFDVRGRLVRTLVDGKLDAGPHRFVWDGRNNAGDPVGASTYFGSLQAGDRRTSQRIVLVR